MTNNRLKEWPWRDTAWDDVRCWGRSNEGQVARAAKNTSVNTVTPPLAPLDI